MYIYSIDGVKQSPDGPGKNIIVIQHCNVKISGLNGSTPTYEQSGIQQTGGSPDEPRRCTLYTCTCISVILWYMYHNWTHPSIMIHYTVQ